MGLFSAAARTVKPLASSCGRAPVELCKPLLYQPGARLGSRHFQRGLAIENSQWFAEPSVGSFGVA